MTRARIRAAIYTRKSSEEGLDQEFNSLDAQREACEAYVRSQAGEGWHSLRDRYDDGGVSGGTMERPALKRLLADIMRGRVDVVVVYKIDRLTRSLADFARMVEIFERHAVSFVSVTQAFNTTSSMGRLTLNVLLSFAQFEREVTGERIRDKIAASKARGMWMGGTPPLGYDPPRDSSRALVVNKDEARAVRTIFRAYLELGSVNDLQRWLASRGIGSKDRNGKAGAAAGGKPFSRGALIHLLRNPVYLGLIRHKDALHQGLHEPVLDRALFDAVQEHLAAHRTRGARGTGSGLPRAPLTGRIFDAAGERMSPTFAVGARGRRYRYYVSASLQQGRRRPDDTILRRVPAGVLEQAIAERLRRIAGIDGAAPLRTVMRVDVHRDHVALTLPRDLRRALRADLAPAEDLCEEPSDGQQLRLILPVRFPRQGGAASITPAQVAGPQPDATLIRALRAAHAMLEPDATGRPGLAASPTSPHRRRLVRLAFLAPALQAAILSGHQPPGLTLARLLAADMPIDWNDQMTYFGACRRTG
ncbi:recombinase family protein [Defluviimonas salinarum]|uniref:Recombinase family protein n=1 Tax=Defluviimonas salinarum TaxID=2992147 RepID=A0ABT3IY47_9RHOB|nr:recombinase family protein [Defluviimonas salinarum]MCW3780362.1 recombinase family protein [Defluviimonas salinarum]